MLGGMFARLLKPVASVALVSVGILALLPACKPDGTRVEGTKEGGPEATPAPSRKPEQPEAAPTPLYLPRTKMETARMFNGVHVRATVDSEAGSTATTERDTLSSYELELTLKIKVPQAHHNLAALTQLNSKLPVALPWLSDLLKTSTIDPAYEALYGRKLAFTERKLVRLDELMSRHDFFDCETILRLRNPGTKRTALLLQSDMDVDTDGSDGDRLPVPDGKDPYFQPMTSYRWPKLTPNPNPFLAASEAKLRTRQEELTKAKGLGESRMQALRDALGAARYEVSQLKQFSFLISETDPYIVLPGFMFRGDDPLYTPKIGDYCVVIFDNVIYPAILGDAGPSFKSGEASLRLAKAINSRSSAYSRPVSHLKATYLIFPGSADKVSTPPDLNQWREKVMILLNEMGGYGGDLHAWETTSRPVPTPTPTPTATPVPSATPAVPGISPAPGAATSSDVGGSPTPSTSGTQSAPGGSPAAPTSSPAVTPSPGQSPAVPLTPQPAPANPAA